VRFTDQHFADADWNVDQLSGAELGPWVLPVNDPSDLAFQLVIETDTPAEADEICGVPPQFGPVLKISPGNLYDETFDGTDFANLSGPASDILSGDMQRLRISPTEVFFYFKTLPVLAGGVACDSCFQIAFAPAPNAQPSVVAISNPFIYRCGDTDYTTVLDYASELDEAGFIYCASPEVKNRVRLPLYLTRPLYPEDDDVYRNSAGVTLIRRAVVRKTFEVVTDLFPAWGIECLRAVFIHDYIFADEAPALPQTNPYTGRISKEPGFEPAWLEYKNYPNAPVRFRVEAIDFDLEKNNCTQCGDYSSVLSTDDQNLGLLTAATPYIVDLMPLTFGDCCTALTWELDFFDAQFITVPPVVNFSWGGIQAPFATCAFSTKTPIPPNVITINPLVRIKVSCSGFIDFINITAHT
jgi:hypothetical protein